MDAWVDFGQKVDLTARIREILLNYPEGTSILKEIVQNADDARASVVKFCLDWRSFPTERLLDSKLALFQGPALVVYNNGVFSEKDFKSISKVGDSLKREEVGKTGRFGIGFNSCYHITDLPSFVSGEHLVVFDPHCKYLPHISSTNPGKKINFVQHNVVEECQDQVAPYKCFGCDMRHPYPATLFRFPLRHQQLAAQSTISHQVYSPEKIRTLLTQLQQECHLIMLFLKAVTTIEILEWQEGASEGTRLFTCEVPHLTPQLLSERSLFLKSWEKQLAGRQLASIYVLELEGRDHISGLVQEHRYLISQRRGLGHVSDLAAQLSAQFGVTLVPWGAVAASLMPGERDEKELGGSGLAFCFLPLPTHTHLPVHVNGFFELSSNRRDIWTGTDMSGTGHLRAVWNIKLLEEVLAPAYADMLAHAATLLGSHSDYFRLFPTLTEVQDPWLRLVKATYRHLVNQPVLWTKSLGGMFLTPEVCVMPDLQGPALGGLEGALVKLGVLLASMPNWIVENLLKLLPSPPALVSPSLARQSLRQHSSTIAKGSLLSLADDVPDLLEYCLSDVDLNSKEAVQKLVGLYLLPMQDNTLRAFEDVMLQGTCQGRGESREVWKCFLTSDDEQALLERLGLYLIEQSILRPSVLTSLRQLASLSALNVCTVTAPALADHFLPRLLPLNWRHQPVVDMAEGAACGIDKSWVQRFWQWLADHPRDLSWFRDWPLLPVNSEQLAGLKPKDKSIVVQRSDDWPPGLSEALQKLGCVLLNTLDYQLPSALLVPYVHPPGGMGVLAALGVAISDLQQATGGGPSASASCLLARNSRNAPDTAPNAANVRDRQWFQQLEPSERQLLRSYLLQPRWFSGMKGQELQEAVKVLQFLPIYEVLGLDLGIPGSCASTTFTKLNASQQYFITPPGVLSSALPPDCFLPPANEAERQVLVNYLGVHQPSSASVYRVFILPRVAGIPSGVRNRALRAMLLQLPQLVHQDNKLVELLKQVPFVPNEKGDLLSPTALYDPRIRDLAALLNLEVSFPAEEFLSPEPDDCAARAVAGGPSEMTEERSSGSAEAGAGEREVVLNMLVQLGMRTTARMDTILSAAQYVQQLAEEDEDKAVERGQALLAYLEVEIHRILPASPTPQTSHPAKFIPLLSRMSDMLRTPPGQSAHTVNPEVERFWSELGRLRWCPVMHQPPLPSVPWPSHRERLAAPRAVRPAGDMWLVSSVMAILEDDNRSPLLCSGFGWSSPVAGSILAHQLVQLGELHAQVKDEGTAQLLAGVVPVLYRTLLSLDKNEMEIARAVLQGARCVWIGNGFAPADRVAFQGALDLSPYLYVLPMELAPFHSLLRQFGAQLTFSASQYVAVLQDVHEAAPGESLGEQQLHQAIAVVQSLADLPQLAEASGKLLVPDQEGILRHVAELAYNDAPWLGETVGMGSVGINESRPGGLALQLLVHPKISNLVAERLGVASLRRRLIASAGEGLSLGLASVEAFGQSEALTTRLRHIIGDYPEGPGVLTELVQNADDAGAKQVAFLLDLQQYPVNSILAPAMAPWQGPALLAYNDATFSPLDFNNIARIGQDSKLSRPTSIGRFGLGFNAVYHFTDVPSFISGDYLVMFDPHAKYLPGVSAVQPGLKIAFQRADLRSQFPDAFQPYMYFGCDMRRYYNGTLFRFPLRGEQTGAASDIKSAPCTPDEVMHLLSSFQSQLPHVLLFLKSVRSIAIYLKDASDVEPRLVVRASIDVIHKGGDRLPVPAQPSSHPQEDILRFISGRTGGDDLKQFYSRLSAHRSKGLPSSSALVALRLEGPGVAAEGEDVRKAAQNGETTVHGAARTGLSLVAEEQWMVCNSLASGPAADLSLEAFKTTHTKMMPWVGVAARVDTIHELAEGAGTAPGQADLGTVPSASHTLSAGGRAFCFLPLPVDTGLPVHINGYFELSSNRRDIWYGKDLEGAGKLRSSWNAALLSDALPTCYVHLLLELTRVMGPHENFFRLFPNPAVTEPWVSLVHNVYQKMASVPVLWTAGGGGRWLPPQQVLVMDQHCQQNEELTNLLILDGLPIATSLPSSLVLALQEFCPATITVSPPIVREHFKRKRAHPATHQILSTGLPASTLLLSYCLQDMEEPSQGPEGDQKQPMDFVQQLASLPLLPLADGLLGVLMVTGNTAAKVPNLSNSYIVTATLQELALLEGMRNRVVHPGVDEKLRVKLIALASTGVVNLQPMTCAVLDQYILPELLPSSWKGAEYVEWMGKNDRHGITPSWLQALWQWLGMRQDLADLKQWPLLPVKSGHLRSLARGKVLQEGDWSEEVTSSLEKLGCPLLRSSLFTTPSPALSHFVQPATAEGVLEVISSIQQERGLVCLSTQAEQLTTIERRRLRAYLMQNKWFATDGGLSRHMVEVLKSLPIFETYEDRHPGQTQPGHELSGHHQEGVLLPDSTCVEAHSLGPGDVDTPAPPSPVLMPEARSNSNNEPFQAPLGALWSGEAHFTALTNQQVYLPPRGVDAQLLDSSFIIVESETEAHIYEHYLGVSSVSLAIFLKDHLAPRADSVDKALVKELMVGVLRDMDRLVEDDPVLLELLRDLPLVHSRGGSLRAPSSLCHPRSHDLAVLLDPSEDFPAAPYDREPQLLSALMKLSLMTTVNMKVLVYSARLVAGSTSSPPVSFQRSQMLLEHLDKWAQAQESGGAAEDSLDKEYWQELYQICWCPVLKEAPDPALPWPYNSEAPVFAPPKIVRPLGDAWLVSAPLRLLAGSCSDALARRMRWAEPPPPSVPLAQLLELAKMYPAPKVTDEGLATKLDQASQGLYRLLTSCLGNANQKDLVEMSLESHPACIWVGSGYTASDRVVLLAEADFRPLLFSLAPDYHQYHALMTAAGVRERYEAQHFVAGLRVLHETKEDHPLTDAELALALQMADSLAEVQMTRGRSSGLVFLPDSEGVLCPSSLLHYHDASWLDTGGLRIAHPGLSHAAAEQLGVRSMRYHHELNHQLMEAMPCPSLPSLMEKYHQEGAHPLTMLWEIMEMAELAGAHQMRVILDLRQHGQQSLLHPGLSDLQGPALCIVLPDVILNKNELCDLLMPSAYGGPNYTLKGRQCVYGGGLQSAFVLTDVLQVISNASLYLWDPSGRFLAQTAAEVRHCQPRGCIYQHVVSDLISRFQDQFLPWDFAPDYNICKPVAATLIRMPLRQPPRRRGPTNSEAAEAEQGPYVFDPVEMRRVLEHFKEHAGRSLLFLRGLRSVVVQLLDAEEHMSKRVASGQEAGHSCQISRGQEAEEPQATRGVQEEEGRVLDVCGREQGPGTSGTWRCSVEYPPGQDPAGTFSQERAQSRKGFPQLLPFARHKSDTLLKRTTSCWLVTSEADKGLAAHESWRVTWCAEDGMARQGPSSGKPDSRDVLETWGAVAVCESRIMSGPGNKVLRSEDCFQPASGLFAPLPVLPPSSATDNSEREVGASTAVWESLGDKQNPTEQSALHSRSPDGLVAPQADMSPPRQTERGPGREVSAFALQSFLIAGSFSLSRAGGRHAPSSEAVMKMLSLEAKPGEEDVQLSQALPRVKHNRQVMNLVVAAWLSCLQGSVALSSRGGQHSNVYQILMPDLLGAVQMKDDDAEYCFKEMYLAASRQPVWQLFSHRPVHVLEGCFLQSNTGNEEANTPRGIHPYEPPGPLAVGFLQRHLPILQVPWSVKMQLEAAGVGGLRSGTPAVIRPLLRSLVRKNEGTPLSVSPEECGELLVFCLSDVRLGSGSFGGGGPGPQGLDLNRLRQAVSGASARLPPGVLNRANAFLASVMDALEVNRGSQQDDQQEDQGSQQDPTADLEPYININRIADCRGLPLVDALGVLSLIRLDAFSLWCWPAQCTQLPSSILPPSLAGQFLHPVCNSALSHVLELKAVRKMLGLHLYTTRDLENHLRQVLASNWFLDGSSLDLRVSGPPKYPWNDGDGGGPLVDWLISFWALVLQMGQWTPVYDSEGMSMNPLDPWPLIPLVQGTLLRIYHRQAVFCPPAPRAAQSSVEMSADGTREGPQHLSEGDPEVSPAGVNMVGGPSAPSSHSPWPPGAPLTSPWNWLLPAIISAGCPVLDPRFSHVHSICTPVLAFDEGQALPDGFCSFTDPPGDLPVAVKQTSLTGTLVHKLRLCSELAMFDSARWSGDIWAGLFDLLVGSPPEDVPDKTLDLTFLRSLRIYPTLQGTRGSADVAEKVFAVPSEVRQSVGMLIEDLPEVGQHGLLEYQPTYQGLYKLVGIHVVTLPELVGQVLLPHLMAMKDRGKVMTLMFVQSNWETLKSNGDVRRVLSETAFVLTADGSLRTPSALYDPSHPLFSKVFRMTGDQDKFPTDQFAYPAWLKVLKDVGLQTSVTPEVFLSLTRHVAEHGVVLRDEGSGDSPVLEAGEALLQYLTQQHHSLPGRDFYKELAEVPFVPCYMGHPHNRSCRRILSSFSSSAAMKDWPLVWTVMPLMPDEATKRLPSSISTFLRLKSPPPFPVIAEHLNKVGEGEGEQHLSSWPAAAGRVEDATCQVLEYLRNEGLSPAQRDQLRTARFVPVANGTRLVAPGRLFVRLKDDLAPFAYEVPTVFATYLDLLRELGAGEEPSARHLLSALWSFHEEVAGRTLNINQCRAVVHLLTFLGTRHGGPDVNFLKQEDTRRRMVVLTADARLEQLSRTVYVSSVGARILGRTDARHLVFVHPQVPEGVCRWLGVPSLQDTVEEVLDRRIELQELPALQGRTRESVTSLLTSSTFLAALSSLVHSQASVNPALKPVTPQKVSRLMAQAASKMTFVRELHTRIILKSTSRDITRNDSVSRVYEYLSPETGQLLLADPPAGLGLDTVLSQALSRVLGSPVTLPLHPLLSCPPDALPSLQPLLMSSGFDQDLEHAAQAGQLGSPLLPSDEAMLQLKPLRRYAAGELVAYLRQNLPATSAALAAERRAALMLSSTSESESANSLMHPLRSSPGRQLCYGRVAEDTAASGSTGVYKILIETEPGVFAYLMSSEVFCFTNVEVRQQPGSQADTLEPQQVSGNRTSQQHVPSPPSPIGLQTSTSASPFAVSSSTSFAGVGSANVPSASPEVTASELVTAVRDILAAAHLPLDLERSELVRQAVEASQTAKAMEKQVVELEKQLSGSQREVETTKTNWQCRVCLTHEVDAAFVGCGHMLCWSCSRRLNACPICRKPSTSVRLYK